MVRLGYVAVCLGFVCVSSSARAQAGVTERGTVHEVELRATPGAALRPPPINWDVGELSRYVGWGGAIGAVGGWGWGTATDHKRTRGVDTMFDALGGFCIGMVGGTVVYVVRVVRQAS